MRKNKFGLGAGALALNALILAVNLPAVCAVEQNKMPAPPMTVTVVTHANKAAKAYNGQQWAEAKNEFRICIGEKPQFIPFYEGLFHTGMKAGEWDQVSLALDKIFALDPSQKVVLSYEYGQALFHLNRFDEAIPYLKNALKTVNIQTPEYIPPIYPMPEPTGTTPPPLPPTTPPPVPPRVIEVADPHKALSFLNAATHSECILLAEFDGYEKSNDVAWNHPPEARYKVSEILKGPPLTHSLPVKYEFHNLVDTETQKGWKFNDKEPAKGSKWILFIEFAVPKRGMFELYQGSYGRQPATDENLNTLYGLLDQYNMRNTHS